MMTIKYLKGFTLLEVMLAMAIFAIAGVALMSSAENNFRHLGTLEQRMLANMVASNQLVAANLENTWPPKNKKKGKVEMAGREWFWQQQVIKTLDKDMRAIVMEIRFEEKDEQPIATLMTYVSKAY